MNEKHLRTLAVRRHFERWISTPFDAPGRDHGFTFSIAANDFMLNAYVNRRPKQAGPEETIHRPCRARLCKLSG
jgi:hypothetical protein